MKYALLVVLLAGCGHIDDPPPQNASYVSWTNQGASGTNGSAPAPASSATTTSAEMTRGPVTVSSQPSGHTVADRRLAEQIRKKLVAEPTLKDAQLDRVRVVTTDGKVTLNGIVPTSADASTIEQKIRELKDVTGVDNQIEVLH